jgi:anti-anti-sigma regulatory factor
MTAKFRSLVDREDDTTLVELSGTIDEDNGLAALVDQLPVGKAVIDLAKIERITSYGVRDWVSWLNKLDQKGIKVVLAACSPAIVAQLNLVADFTGRCTVKSFFLPYVCLRCDRETAHLVEVAELGPPPYAAPARRCDKCASALELDGVEERYFAFLSATSTWPRRG